jgi:hypothetical protein
VQRASSFNHLRTNGFWYAHCVTEGCRLDVRIAFAAAEKRKIIVITEIVRDSQAGSKRALGKYLLSLFIALAFALTITPSKANAQITGDLLANIPFQFHAGNATLPAGEYRIHFVEDSDLRVMQITSADGTRSALFQVQDTEVKSTPTKSELVFNQYGDRYFLATLFEEGSDIGSQVIESREEKASGQQTMQAQEHVPAYRQTQRGN